MIRRFIKILTILFFASSILAVIVLRFLPVYITPLMVIRTIQQMSEGEKPTFHHQWVSRKHISKNLKRAVIASEDQLFYDHWGFDVGQIKKAVHENGRRKKPRGASTISQQTAKNVFLWPKSSWLRKGLESYFTVLIEVFWSKDRILEVYLNSMETGDGIYGAEAVAQDHFHTKAENLTKRQSALIAATLPNPIRFNSRHPSSYIRRRQAQIQRQMRYVRLPEK
ncbi:MAG: monofunctional biosynthetic peptidoglycan transglycosylase [Bacteroidales bacterium]|nr:monofunctional biosynthetic peptidoglycan transglycosylase [Bacteroidales bacterium]